MILVKNYYDNDNYIAITEEGCRLVSAEKLNCSTRGCGAVISSSELILIFVHNDELYFQYNENIYPLKEYNYHVSNISTGDGMRMFTFSIEDKLICSINYSEYIPPSYSGEKSQCTDFLMFITRILEDERASEKYIKEIETLNRYYGT